MLYYVTTKRHSLTLAPLLLYYRSDLTRKVRVLPYEHLELLREIASGVVIWTDFDRLDVKAGPEHSSIDTARRPKRQRYSLAGKADPLQSDVSKTVHLGDTGSGK